MTPPSHADAEPLFICVSDGSVLVSQGPGGAEFPATPPAGERHMLGSLGDRPCVAIDGTGLEVSGSQEWIGLRRLHGLVCDQLWAIAARAVQIVEWDRTNRFCGRCGSATERDLEVRVRHCPNCGLEAFPRVSPAIIVLVTRGDHDEEALLAWGRRMPRPHYSTLAGFVEPGETLEETLHREIREETGIEVTDLSYFGSQSWPFPHQLMVGYRARYASGQLRIQESEIVEARWFTPAEVGQVTASRGAFSIAGQLIDGWIAEQVARVRVPD
jgi:NAD+ diphosphatase